LILTCRDWSNIAKISQAKAEWLLEQYKEKQEQALFYAVRLGPIFINVELCEILINEKNVIISKCFIEKLLTHFGRNVDNQFETTALSWGSNLPLSVFKYLLERGYDNRNNDPSLYEKDMELFNSWSVGDRREIH
jgi:hypothetical protein